MLLDEALAAEPTHERSLDSEVDRTRMRACILGVVDHLPTSQRAAILLGELRGPSDRELADALGTSGTPDDPKRQVQRRK